MSDLIRCPRCGQVLAEKRVDCTVIRHRGREITVQSLVACKCEKCGAVWQPVVNVIEGGRN